MTSSDSDAASTQPSTTPQQVHHFALEQCKPHWRVFLCSAFFMLLSTLCTLGLATGVNEILAVGDLFATKRQDHEGDTKSSRNDADASSAGSGNMQNTKAAALAMSLFGSASESVLMPVVRPFIKPIVLFISPDFDSTTLDFIGCLVCRGLLCMLIVALSHFTSLLGHIFAYQAGVATQNSLTQRSLSRILHTSHPERIAVSNAVKVTQITLSSGRALCDAVGAALTDLFSGALKAVGLFIGLCALSPELTFTILGLVIIVQGIYFVAGRAQGARGALLAKEEASVQAHISNAIQRSETIFVFHCRAFLIRRLQQKLEYVQSLSSRLNWSIHGFAAISSGCTNCIFVFVLCMSSFFRFSGKMAFAHIGLYFTFLSSFLNILQSLASNFSKMRASLGQMESLMKMLDWFQTEDREEEGDEKKHVKRDEVSGKGGQSSVQEGGRVELSEDPSTIACLVDVSFEYPAVPAFMREDVASAAMPLNDALAQADVASATAVIPAPGPSSGVQHMNITVKPFTITALFGPSGCGKSTTLRLLSGLVRPAQGQVITHAKTLLLEQQRAIFMGSVAENILLQEIPREAQPSGFSTSGTSESASDYAALQSRVIEAVDKGGCASFLQDPFHTFIESVDQPQFSGGQLQRLSIARVFAHKEGCTLLLLDEPTTGLDKVSVEVLLTTLKELRDVHGKTVLISTHDPRVAEVADCVIDMSHNVAS